MENKIITANNSLSRFEKHFIEHFLDMKRRKSENTAVGYDRDIRDFFQVNDICEVSLDMVVSVSIFDVERYIMDMEDLGLASATINRKVSSLSSLYKWLLKYQDNKRDIRIIKYNPFGSLKEEKPSVNNKETEFMTLEESKRLIGSIDVSKPLGKRNKAILALAITTALRKSEMINIKIQDIKEMHGHYIINVTRKGNKRDFVKLQPDVRGYIEAYLESTNRTFEGNSGEYLFIGHSRNKKNKEKLDPSSLNYMIKKCAEKAGINKKIKVHSTRHTAITLAITSGATIEKVRDFAAHKNIATTNRYVHSIDKLKDNAGDMIKLFD